MRQEKIIEDILKEKKVPLDKKFIELIVKLRKCPPMVGIGVQRKGNNQQSKKEKFYLPLAKAGIVVYNVARGNKVIFTLRQEIRTEISRRLMVTGFDKNSST